jgi:hypothetical protein
MTNPINPKTGKPYSNTTMWIHKHPERMEKQRQRMRTSIELEKSSIRTLKNKEHLREVKLKYYRNNKEKLMAKRKLTKERQHSNYMANYHTELKESCELCGSTKELERHHWNYDKPLLVNTLCKTCHKIQHVKDFARWHKCKLEADKQLNNMITS